MSYFKSKSMKWIAPVALVGALGLAACGDGDSSDSASVEIGSGAVGSDEHLNNQAAELARSAAVGSDQHLANQAAELANEQRAYQAASDRLSGQAAAYQRSYQASAADVVAVNAEAIERNAKLDNAAELYGSDAGPNAFEAGNRAAQAGNRAAQMAEAERYVDQQSERAQPSSDDGFVPGSRRMPN
jgi:hypothetical protein